MYTPLVKQLEAIPDPAVRAVARAAAAYIRATAEPHRWYDAKTAIAAIAAPLVLELAEKNMGYPGAFHIDDGTDPLGAIASNNWKQVLMEIHWGLEQILIDDPQEDEEKRFKASLELFGKWFNHLWD